MTENIFFKLKQNSIGNFKIKKSEFISYAYVVRNEEEIKDILKQIRKKHYDANHIPYAYILGTKNKKFFCSDDGEPSNSAGQSILNTIRSFNITNVLLLVVRYFGGVKLGIPGLIDAFKSASIQAINNNQIIEFVPGSYFELIVDNNESYKLINLLKKNKVNIIENNINFNNSILIYIPVNQRNLLYEQIEPLIISYSERYE